MRTSRRRRLEASRMVDGDRRAVTAAFEADPGRWLPAPARRSGGDRWTVDLSSGPLTRSVACRVGSVWQVDGDTWRSVGWEVRPEPGDVVAAQRLLPRFQAELGLRDTGGGLVLTLRGLYQPPAGRLGSMVDAAALHGFAQATAERFLSDIGHHLEAAADARLEAGTLLGPHEA